MRKNWESFLFCCSRMNWLTVDDAMTVLAGPLTSHRGNQSAFKIAPGKKKELMVVYSKWQKLRGRSRYCVPLPACERGRDLDD